MEQNSEPRNSPAHVRGDDFYKGAEASQWENRITKLVEENVQESLCDLGLVKDS